MSYENLCNEDTSNMTDEQKHDLKDRVVVQLKDRENEIENIQEEMGSLFAKLCELGLDHEWTGAW